MLHIGQWSHVNIVDNVSLQYYFNGDIGRYMAYIIQDDFFHWYPPKKLKYVKPRLGESKLT